VPLFFVGDIATIAFYLIVRVRQAMRHRREQAEGEGSSN
jgi:hypothetical protein